MSIKNKININIKNNLGISWCVAKFQSCTVHVKGFAFKNNVLFKQDKLALLFYETVNGAPEVDRTQKLIVFLKELNGNFVVVINEDKWLFAAVDRMRSIPLFYSFINAELVLTDEVEYIKKRYYLNKLDELKISEFMLTGYTCNDSTLFEEVKQIQAGELLYFNIVDRKFESYFYFLHTHGQYISDQSRESVFAILENISSNITKRLIESADNRTIVVPLSGGYDSRYIVCMLKKTGYENVLCYSYGSNNSFEANISQKVAKRLGYKWHGVVYDYKKWKAFYRSDWFVEYCKYSFNYCSLPHFQDFIAVKELTENKKIPKHSIIVPGYCGDLLGGSYISSEIAGNGNKRVKLLLKNGIDDYILRKHFNLGDLDNRFKNAILGELHNFTRSFTVNNIEDFISANESWFTNHKIAKFVVNSIRVYEYFDYEWRMPLWDNELMDFWYKIPLKSRRGSTLYNKYLFEKYFIPFDVAFYKNNSIKNNKIIVRMQQYLPVRLQKLLKKIYLEYLRQAKRNDVNGFLELNKIMYKDIVTEKSLKEYTSINKLLVVLIVQKFLREQ